jgi:hypothetical protein
VPGRGLVGFGFCFRFDCGKKLRCHHSHSALKNSLADSGNRASHLRIAFVGYDGQSVSFFKIERACSFDESRLSAPVNHHAKMMRRLDIFEAHRARKYSFDRADTRFESCRKGILAGFFEPLAARYAPLQDCRVGERFKDALARRV